MFKKLPLFALLAMMFTASVSQASNYIPDPGCWPCVANSAE